MRCPYCGKELVNGAMFCDGCGAQLGGQQPYQQPMNYGYGYQQPPKKSGGTLALIIILSIVLVAGIAFGIWFFALRGDSNSENNTVNNTINTNTNTNTNINTNVNTNTNTNTVTPTGNTTSFLGYTLSIPSGYSHGTYAGKDYIESDGCVIMYLEYQLSYDMILANEESFVNSFESQGLKVSYHGAKTYSGDKYYILIGKLDNVEYGYMFGSLAGSKPFFVTITAQDLGSIKDQWFVDASRFFGTAR